MKLVEDQTRIGDRDCIKFVPRTVETTYIRVINDTGCYSYVGKQAATGVQNLSLRVPGCLVHGTIAHEFIHALGFWHEQSRPDRDEYVQVVWDKITTGKSRVRVRQLERKNPVFYRKKNFFYCILQPTNTTLTNTATTSRRRSVSHTTTAR